jgi:hypothetical protein
MSLSLSQLKINIKFGDYFKFIFFYISKPGGPEITAHTLCKFAKKIKGPGR